MILHVFPYSNAFAKKLLLYDDLSKDRDCHNHTENTSFFTIADSLFPISYSYKCQLNY